MMLGSEFVKEFAPKGPAAWEAAALELARAGNLVPWPWVDIFLTDGTNTASIKVQSDVLSIGTTDDHVRLPLTPSAAQSIFNLQGWLLPTPWLVYQIWKNAGVQLPPTALAPNLGANLGQYAAHSALIDSQIRNLAPSGPPNLNPPNLLIAGEKKHVIVSNIYKPGKVLIFGWYRPSPPAPDIFDDARSMMSPERQPVQPKSNVHGDFYVDYSHGIQAVAPTALVNGQPISTVDLYQHPTLSKLVSNEGPVRVPRYPARVPPPVPVAVSSPTQAFNAQGSSNGRPIEVVATTPGIADWGLSQIEAMRRGQPI